MVELYLKKIKADDIAFTLEDVPALWKQKVMDKLVEDGYTLNEDGSVVKEQVDFVGNLVLKRMFYGEWINFYSPIYISGYSSAWLERLIWDQVVAGSNPVYGVRFALIVYHTNIQRTKIRIVTYLIKKM